MPERPASFAILNLPDVPRLKILTIMDAISVIWFSMCSKTSLCAVQLANRKDAVNRIRFSGRIVIKVGKSEIALVPNRVFNQRTQRCITDGYSFYHWMANEIRLNSFWVHHNEGLNFWFGVLKKIFKNFSSLSVVAVDCHYLSEYRKKVIRELLKSSWRQETEVLAIYNEINHVVSSDAFDFLMDHFQPLRKLTVKVQPTQPRLFYNLSAKLLRIFHGNFLSLETLLHSKSERILARSTPLQNEDINVILKHWYHSPTSWKTVKLATCEMLHPDVMVRDLPVEDNVEKLQAEGYEARWVLRRENSMALIWFHNVTVMIFVI